MNRTAAPTAPTSTHEQLLAAACAAVPVLRDAAAQAEALGHLPPEIAASLHDAGFFALHVPPALGGLGASIRTAVDVHLELARGSGPAAWCAVILSSGGLIASRLPAAGREELWAEDPRAGVCGSFLPGGTGRRVPGGLQVTGRWQPLSGVHHARWVFVPVLVQDDPDARPAVVAVAMPVAEVEVQRTWDAVGMTGTGSDTVVAHDVFVPDRRSAPFGALLGGGATPAGTEEPLLGVSAYSAGAVCAGAVLVGMARAALERTIAVLQRGRAVAASRYADALDAPSVRLDVALAARLVDTAGLHLDRATDDVERGARSGHPLDLATRGRIRMDLATISTSVREALQHLLDANGARAFASTDPLQRIWRDVEVISRHPMLTPGTNTDVYSRTLLGIEEQVVALV